MVMGNHGIIVLGDTVADAFNRLYFFERAAQTLIMAYMTNKPLRTLSHETASKTARELEEYPGQAERHLAEIKQILDEEEPAYAS